MALQECGFGHIYDTDLYATCPYCSNSGNRIDFGAGAGVPNGNLIGATVAPSNYSSKTVAPSNNRSNQSETGKTVGVFQKKMSFDPVVGWLVCVSGPEKGKDYRIFGRNNTIGRDDKMDICLKGDSSISRENHAKLAYDRKHNVFHIIPADGKNPVYLNDEPVYVPMALKERDILEIGDFKLAFIPYCKGDVVWEDEHKNVQKDEKD